MYLFWISFFCNRVSRLLKKRKGWNRDSLLQDGSLSDVKPDEDGHDVMRQKLLIKRRCWSGESSFLIKWHLKSTRNRKNRSNRPYLGRYRRFSSTLTETLIAYDFTFCKSTFFGRKLTMGFSFKFKLKIGNDSDSFITSTIMWGSVGPLKNDSHSWNIGWPVRSVPLRHLWSTNVSLVWIIFQCSLLHLT